MRLAGGPLREEYSQRKKILEGPSLWFSGWDSMVPVQGAQVRSLVGELGSLTYQVAALKKEKILEEAERPEQDSWRLNQSV